MTYKTKLISNVTGISELRSVLNEGLRNQRDGETEIVMRIVTFTD